MRRISASITRYFFLEGLPFALLAYLVLSFLIAIQQLGRQTSITLLSLATPQESLFFILLIVPGISLITLPMAILIGTLIALNRLKADSEMTAARACGLSPLATNLPFAIIGVLGAVVSLALTMSVIPRTLQKLGHFRTLVLARGLIGQVKPQTFETRFPGHLVYIQQVDQQSGDWLGVFLLRQARESEPQSLVLTARRGQLRIVETPEVALEIQLSDGVSLLMAEDPNQNSVATFEKSFLRLTAQRDIGTLDALSLVNRVQAMGNRQLASFVTTAKGDERTVARIEWHKRRAVPISNVILVLIAIVIGLRSQKPRSKAIGIALGFSIAVAYYLLLTAGQNLAQSRVIEPWAGIWGANIIGLIFAISSRYLRLHLRLPVLPGWPAIRRTRSLVIPKAPTQRSPLTPRISNLINYLLISEIVRIFVLGIAVLVMTTLVFTLFDLIPSIARSQARITFIASYFAFLSPQILYYTAPFALLIGTLTAYFVLSRTNQLVILSASGLSLARIIVPIALFALTVAAALFFLSDRLLPYTNREQDARYHLIKGKKLDQAAFALGKQWVYGSHDQIFSFHFVKGQKLLLKTYVYKLKATNQLIESVTFLSRAEAVAGTQWSVFEGWRLNVAEGASSQAASLPASLNIDLGEGQATFERTINESSKLSFGELYSYIRQLRRIGATADAEQIDLWRRFSHPMTCLTLIALAMPWVVARRIQSRRDTLAGVGIGVVISILFWLTTQAFEIAGKNALLPVSIAVWGAHLTSWSLAAYLWGRRLTR
jgi:LPS export ABC transporter permease LptG